MSSALKAVLWVLVALVVIGGIYYWYQGSHPSAAAPAQQTSEAASQANAPAGPSLASGSNTSDAALQQDLSGMDTQMSAMNSDTASIDQGMNDTAVSQQ